MFNSAEPELRPTTDYDSMRELGLRSGLEDGDFRDFLVAFGYYLGDELIGCAALRQREGLFTVESLAVADGFRKRGLGQILVAKIIEEARSRGATELWAVARAPQFFVRIGFVKVGPEDHRGPGLGSCMKCKQFGGTCSPAVVLRTL